MRTTSKNRISLFFSGVFILTFSNILIKVIGLALKIPLHHILGDEGMFYYNVAYDIYVWLYMISTAGLPVAVSKLIAKSRARGNFKEVKRIFHITLSLFIIVGLAGMGFMMGGSKFLAAAYKMDASYLCIMAIAPTLFFICISSAMRGYFQGYQYMVPTAVSQVIEALGKLIIGILLALYAVNQGYELNVIAAYTILGLTIGVALGMLFLTISKILFKATVYDEEFVHPESDAMQVRPVKKLLGLIVVSAIPITLSSSVMSFTNMIDGMIMSWRLHAIGYTEEIVGSLLGNYKTLAVSLFNMPPALIYPISYSILPLLASAIESGDRAREKLVMKSSMRITSLITLPCAMGLSVLSGPILKLMFDANSSEMAAPLLTVLAPAIFFVGQLTITNAILQAYDHERKPFISMIVGGIVKLGVSYLLTVIPGVEMYAAPIGTFLSYLAITSCNIYFMSKYVGIIPNVREVFVRPFIASIVCAGAALGSYMLFTLFLPAKIATIGAIGCAALVYLIAIFVFDAINADDIMMLPKGRKIFNILHKCRLM